MTRIEAENYLRSSGFSERQISDIESAFTCEDAISRKSFDQRVRMAGFLAKEENIDPDFLDGVLTVLEMLKTEPKVQPTAMIAKIHIDDKGVIEKLKRQLEFANLGIVEPAEHLEIISPEKIGPWISIPDVMSVFDDFSQGEASEDEKNTFFEMLKDKAMEGRS